MKRGNLIGKAERAVSSAMLRSLLSYDPNTGVLLWQNRAGRGAWLNGARAGCVKYDGYRLVRCFGHLFCEHRVIWCLVTGDWPTDTIDHRDRNPGNNAWSNLRLASPSEQLANTRLPSTNTSGVRGVSRDPKSGKWRALIRHKQKLRWLGQYPTKDEARAAYERAAIELWGAFFTER